MCRQAKARSAEGYVMSDERHDVFGEPNGVYVGSDDVRVAGDVVRGAAPSRIRARDVVCVDAQVMNQGRSCTMVTTL
jgi:hypothetical protein